MSFFIANAFADAPATTTATANQAAATGGSMGSLLLLIGFVVIFYLLIWLPQRKRAKEQRDLLTSLTKGDEVITNGGIYGRITNITDEYIVLAIADNVEIKMQKNAVAAVLPKGSLKVGNNQ
jgi:preprotein translocase subunit YajC